MPKAAAGSGPKMDFKEMKSEPKVPAVDFKEMKVPLHLFHLCHLPYTLFFQGSIMEVLDPNMYGLVVGLLVGDVFPIERFLAFILYSAL